MAGWLKSLQSTFKNLALSVVSVALFLAVAEGVCRLVERPEPAYHASEFAVNWDEVGGEFFTAMGWPGTVDFNHEGLRDREHALDKLPGVRRVMCLGDSTTYGQHLNADEAFPRVLEELLEERGGGVEVFNVSLSGWSARQQLIAYRRICRKYQPDQVLLGICLNDVGDMQNNLRRPPAALTALHRRSALMRRIVGASGREIRDVSDLFKTPLSENVHQGYSRLFAEIKTLRDEARADGASFAVLVFPFRFQLEPEAPPPLPQTTIAEFCAREGMGFLDLLPAFIRVGPDTYVCDHHFDASGARLVAQEIVAAGLVRPADRESTPILPKTVPQLIRALQDPDPRVRVAAVSALGRAKTPEASRGLVRALADGNENVCLGAAEALENARIGPALLPELIQTLDSSSGLCRAVTARAIGLNGPDAHDATPLLMAALTDERFDVRRWSAWALGQVGAGARAAVPALISCVSDQEMGWIAIEALGRIGPHANPAVPTLITRLRDDRAAVRRLSAQALGRIGPPAQKAMPALFRALRDRRQDVQIAAVRALVRIEAEPGRVIPKLERMLAKTHETSMRLELEAALRKMRRRERGKDA